MKTPLLALGHKWLMSVSQETQNPSYMKSMACFLSIYTLNDEFYNVMGEECYSFHLNCRGK